MPHIHLKLISNQEKLTAQQIKSDFQFIKEIIFNGSCVLLKFELSKAADLLDEFEKDDIDLRKTIKFLQDNFMRIFSRRQNLQKLDQVNFGILRSDGSRQMMGFDWLREDIAQKLLIGLSAVIIISPLEDVVKKTVVYDFEEVMVTLCRDDCVSIGAKRNVIEVYYHRIFRNSERNICLYLIKKLAKSQTTAKHSHLLCFQCFREVKPVI